LKRAMLGSAAERVVRLARCPVMVVPLPAASKQQR
jgi:nucleotide-binding universal stress UspA family protein